MATIFRELSDHPSYKEIPTIYWMTHVQREDPWALDRSAEFLSQGEDVNQTYKSNFSHT